MEKGSTKNRVEKRSAVLRETGCRFGRAFFLLQEKWILFVLHRLLSGPLGFNELGRGEPPVNPTTLSQCLGVMEAAGLVTREVHSTIPPKTSYELTEAGRAFEPILKSIGKWSEKYLADLSCDVVADEPKKTRKQSSKNRK